jgi:UDP-glucose 4-epimerase
MSKHLRVLVTGGAGFIGSQLVRLLAGRGGETVVVDNLVNGRRENLADVLDEHTCLKVADVRDTARMAELLRGVEIVYHLACLGVRHSLHSPHENHEVNAMATLGLLSAARAAGVRRFVHVSTSEVYGTARHVPMTEEHPTFPKTVYGASKLAGECYTRAFFNSHGFPTVVVRPFNAYGPRCHHEGDSGEVIPRFLLRCLVGRPLVVFGDGTQTRDFSYVTDVASGILAAGLAPGVEGETINLGAGREISINALAAVVAAVAGLARAEVVHEAPRPGDVLRLYADATKARRLLGYEPEMSLREGLERLRDWYLAQGQRPEELLRAEVVRNWERQEATARV